MGRPTVPHPLTGAGVRPAGLLPGRDAVDTCGAHPCSTPSGAKLRRSRFDDAIALRRAVADPALHMHGPLLAAASVSVHRGR